MKIISHIKAHSKIVLVGLIGVALVLNAMILVAASQSFKKKITNNQTKIALAEMVTPKPTRLSNLQPSSAQPEASPQSSDNVPATSTSPRQQKPSGYSPDHIKNLPPSSILSLKGISVTASRSDNSCVLTMHASVMASGTDGSGEVRFSVTNSQVSPSETNVYSGFFTAHKDQVMQVTKSTGPLITWPYVTELYVSATLVGHRALVGAPSGITSTSVRCL